MAQTDQFWRALLSNAVVAADPLLPFGGIWLSGYWPELAEQSCEFVNADTWRIDEVS